MDKHRDKKRGRKREEEEEEEEEHTKKPKTKSLLAQKVAKKIGGARFRWINQKLYTCSSHDAAQLFVDEPDLFVLYHKGFKEQVEQWPVNPLDNLIEFIKGFSPETVVTDFGCGEARLAQSVPQCVHSFDFVAVNDHVVSCDMSHVPLDDSSVDVGVFCLSLMGVNLVDYLLEARRVIKLKGILKIYEIQSRIVSVDEFVSQVESLGFKFRRKVSLSKMFVDLEFVVKNKRTCSVKEVHVELKPCFYKRR